MIGFRVFLQIIKRTKSDKILCGFAIYFFLCAGIIMLVEPEINGYGNAVWYSFSVITSIGFGDFVAITFIGRAATIILGLYGLVVLAMIPGIFTSYYLEIVKLRAKDSVETFLHQLEHLEELPKEELSEISERVRNWELKL